MKRWPTAPVAPRTPTRNLRAGFQVAAGAAGAALAVVLLCGACDSTSGTRHTRERFSPRCRASQVQERPSHDTHWGFGGKRRGRRVGQRDGCGDGRHAHNGQPRQAGGGAQHAFRAKPAVNLACRATGWNHAFIRHRPSNTGTTTPAWESQNGRVVMGPSLPSEPVATLVGDSGQVGHLIGAHASASGTFNSPAAATAARSAASLCGDSSGARNGGHGGLVGGAVPCTKQGASGG